jgi:hypothetical protein
MGNTKKYFKSESKANNFAKHVKGEVTPNCGRDQSSYRVRFDTWGQSQNPRHWNTNFDEGGSNFDSDLNGNGTNWHTADDL